MGANKNLDLQKCGEILIHMKNKNRKTKMFTFHCTFCDVNCDQLKKFSTHLEKHLHLLADELEETKIIVEPDIKVEQNAETELVESETKENEQNTNWNDIYEDPLDVFVEEPQIAATVTEKLVEVKKENCNEKQDNFNDIQEYTIDELENFDCDIVKDDKDYESSIDSRDNEEMVIDALESTSSKKVNKRRSARGETTKKSVKSEDSCDDSNDADFDVTKEVNTPIKQKRSKKHFKPIDESHLPILIELYKKYDLLWQINNIAFGITAKRDEEIRKMVEDLKETHNIEIAFDDMQNHINCINHLYSKDKDLQLKCEKENKEFKPISKFFGEMSFLKECQGPFKCSICNVVINKFEHYHIHVAKHNGTLPFKCTLCEMGFDRFNKYVVHIKRHLGVYSFHCSICGKGYPFKAELDWHLTSHTGDKPYLCPICGAGFRARHGYDNHIRRHEKRFRYECHICKHGFNHLHRLNSHVKSHLNIRDILCNVCGKGFTARKYLQRHKLIHDEAKRYKCNVCGKAFAQDSGLRAHRKQHQPYSAIAENKNRLVKSLLDL